MTTSCDIKRRWKADKSIERALPKIKSETSETRHRGISLNSAYHPQTNGLDDSFNQTLINSLKVIDASKEDWDEHLPAHCMHIKEGELLKGGSSHPWVGAFVLGQKLRGEKMSLGRKLPRSSCLGGGHVL